MKIKGIGSETAHAIFNDREKQEGERFAGFAAKGSSSSVPAIAARRRLCCKGLLHTRQIGVSQSAPIDCAGTAVPVLRMSWCQQQANRMWSFGSRPWWWGQRHDPAFESAEVGCMGSTSVAFCCPPSPGAQQDLPRGADFTGPLLQEAPTRTMLIVELMKHAKVKTCAWRIATTPLRP